MTFQEFTAEYCSRQSSTPASLGEIFLRHVLKYDNDGWVLLECVQMDSSYLGSYAILPYGPRNTYPAPPTSPVSPRGVTSDMSVVVATLTRAEFDRHVREGVSIV